MLTLLLLIAALVCCLIGADGVALGRINVVALGLALFMVVQIVAVAGGV